MSEKLSELRAQHAKQIREEAERVREFAGYVISRVESGHADTIGLYAADITASGQRMMTSCATIQGLDVLAEEVR